MIWSGIGRRWGKTLTQVNCGRVMSLLILMCTISCTDTFISSGGSKARLAAGLKRRKKSHNSSSVPQSKRQRLTTDKSGAAAAGSAPSNHQRRGKSSKAKKPSAGARSEPASPGKRKRGQQPFTKPVVRFPEKRKRALKGKRFTGRGVRKTGGGGGMKRRPGGQVFRRRAKAS